MNPRCPGALIPQSACFQKALTALLWETSLLWIRSVPPTWEEFLLTLNYQRVPSSLPLFRITDQLHPTRGGEGALHRSLSLFPYRRSLAARHYLTPVYGRWIMVQAAEFQVPQLVARSQTPCHKKWCHLQVPPPWSPSPHAITNKCSKRPHPRGLPSKFSVWHVQSPVSRQSTASSARLLESLQDHLSWNPNTWWSTVSNLGLCHGSKLESSEEESNYAVSGLCPIGGQPLCL